MSLEQDLLEQRERSEKLFKQLENSPETEITGVVAASGVGGCHSRGDDLWTLRFSLSGWKELGGPLQRSELGVCKRLPEGKIAFFQNRMDPYDVVRIRARLCKESLLGCPQALLLDFVRREDFDTELNAYAKELREPVTFLDPQFGVFTLDRRVDLYQAVSDWEGRPVRLFIRAANSESSARALGVARSLWAAQGQWQQRISGCAVEKLLALKNEHWLPEGESPVTAQEFAERMTVGEISVEADGSFEFFHDDGDLFWGHCITVSGNLTDGPKDAEIAG
jgi:hypothetical protein